MLVHKEMPASEALELCLVKLVEHEPRDFTLVELFIADHTVLFL